MAGMQASSWLGDCSGVWAIALASGHVKLSACLSAASLLHPQANFMDNFKFMFYKASEMTTVQNLYIGRATVFLLGNEDNTAFFLLTSDLVNYLWRSLDSPNDSSVLSKTGL